MMNPVLNMLVYAEKNNQGYFQHELLEEGIKLGFNRFEIRREYFKEFEKEVNSIKKLVDKYNIELFYSVPDEVFVNGVINNELINYLKEAKQLGVKHIKWNIGDFKNFKGSLKELNELTNQGIEINIENDQTQTSGRIESIQSFMEAVAKEQVNIGYVYDLGNWRFVGQSEKEAAEKLKEYVRYIHVKDVKETKEGLLAVGLDHGDINWRSILAVLPKDVPVAIEYPTLSASEILEAKQLLEEAN